MNPMNPFGKTYSLFVVLQIVVGLCFISGRVEADDWPQWRGPQRNGISRETGLLKEWPKNGPKLLWRVTDAGSGYSPPAVVADRLYLLGNEGLDNEFVEALAVKDGKRGWFLPLSNAGGT